MYSFGSVGEKSEFGAYITETVRSNHLVPRVTTPACGSRHRRCTLFTLLQLYTGYSRPNPAANSDYNRIPQSSTVFPGASHSLLFACPVFI